MALNEILREMRTGNAQHQEWADVIEEAMQELVAWQDKHKPSVLIEHDQLDPDHRWMHRPLYTLPPDAQAEAALAARCKPESASGVRRE